MKKNKFKQIKKEDLIKIDGGNNTKGKLDSAIWSIIKIIDKNS